MNYMDEEYDTELQATHPDSADTQPNSKYTWAKIIVLTILLLGLFGAGLVLTYNTLNSPPESFPVHSPITIAPGTSVRDIAAELATQNVVRSETLAYYSIILFHEPTEIKASTYVFDEALTTQEVATRLTEGDFDTDLLTLTLVEGERVSTYATRAAEVIPGFSAETFIELAEPYEGSLFPDTYFIPGSFSEADLVALLRDTFKEQVGTRIETASTTLTTEEILILASIIEREANSPESMKMVAGIFMNRLDIGMPLQADASIEYVIDTPLSELPEGQLAAELRDRKSPYNTYLNAGLPPTPIGNPGLDAITAVLEPADSDYFYYLTGNDGTFYYAETLSQHNQNIARYLR